MVVVPGLDPGTFLQREAIALAPLRERVG